MTTPTHTNRRTVLKGIGTGLAGGAVLTGSAGATERADAEIALRGHNFTPNKATVRLGEEGGSATVRWVNDEVKYSSEEFPVPHDVHLHHHDADLVKSGVFTQMESFDQNGDGDPEPLGPTYYEVEFTENDGDLVIQETGGMVASPSKDDVTQVQLVEEYDSAEIENWGGSVTLDVHCSIHSLLLDVNEGELITQYIQRDSSEPPYQLHAGFLKMDGGLRVTR